MAERLHTLKIPEALPVVIQLENTVLDGFLKNLMQALGELTTEVTESKGKVSANEVNSVALLKQVCARGHRCRLRAVFFGAGRASEGLRTASARAPGEVLRDVRAGAAALQPPPSFHAQKKTPLVHISCRWTS